MATHYDGSASTVSTEQYFIPEIWSDGIYKFFERKSVFRGLVDDFSALVRGKGYGDNINIPEIALASATAKSAGADVAYDATATTTTQLSLNKHYYIGKLFEDIALIQSEADLVAKYSKMMGEALARQFDADIWAEVDGLNDSQALSADDTLTAAVFEAALAALGEADVPYIRNDAVGEGNRGLRSGMVGSLYGIDVYMSNTVSTGGTASTIPGAIFHKSAAAVAVQQEVRVQSEYSIDALGTKVVADLVYGVKLLDDSDNKRGIKFTNVS